MTSRNSISELYAPKYYLFLLKRNWSQSFIYFIILFLSMPVALLIKINNTLDVISWDRARKVLEIAESISHGLILLWGALAIAFAVFSGILFMNFITERKKAYLYHSFPLKRKTHFIVHIAVCISNFLIAFVANAIISLLVFIANGFGDSMIIGAFLSSVTISAVFFLLALSLTVLACALTGQNNATFFLLLCFAFLPLVFYFGAINFITFHSEFINVEYFINEVAAARLSIAFRFFFLLSEMLPYTLLEGIISVAVSVLILVFAYFIYKNRKAELSGKPVISNTLGEVLKYLVLFPVSFYVGYAFCLIGGNSPFWLYFGFLAGAFLVFIFFNLFLYRTQKKMFNGLRGLFIFLICFLIAFGLTYLNVGDSIPEAESVKSVEVQIRGEVYEFKDEETIEFITEQSRKMIGATENREYFSGYVDITFKKPFSIPTARKIPTFANDEFSKLYLTLLNSREYIEAHEKKVQDILESSRGSLYIYLDGLSFFGQSTKDMTVDLNELLSAYLEDIKNPLRYEGHYLSSVYVDGVTLTIYSSDENILNLNYSGQKVYTIRDLYEKGKKEVKDLCDRVRVIELESGEFIEYSGEKANEIIDACVSYDYYRNSLATHPNHSQDYEIQVYLHEEEIHEGEGIAAEYDYYNAFINGKVPDFVISDFESK